jgi:RNA polymerase sigma-70 factor (ECF subfamily)
VDPATSPILGIRRKWEDGTRAWPGVELDPESFAAHLSSRLARATAPVEIDKVHGPDFYLACACAQGNARAIAAFDACFLPQVALYLGPLGRGDSFIAEVVQLVRERLFVAPAGADPKIADYNGMTAIGAWLRVVSVRVALSLLRKEKSRGRAGDAFGERATGCAPDPELDYIKARYSGEFRDAFQTTVHALDAEQKALLRLHYIDGLSVDELGRLFDVHRSTAARWVERARKQIVDETRRKLGDRFQMTASEIDSVLRAIQSELECGLADLLTV